MNDKLQKEIISRIVNYENPKRIALSRKFPFLEKPIIFFRCLKRSIQNILNSRIQVYKNDSFFEFTITKHQSELRKNADFKNVDLKLQENKIFNMKKAAEKLNGIVIKPGKIFSFWDIVGNPSSKNGYTEGRVYSIGKIVTGIGGGLCQLSAFLYWLFLHTPAAILERHPHSLDAFPDSRKNVFSRNGATVLYNFMDLKVRNDFSHPVQLKIWFTENQINGQIVSVTEMQEEFRILEKNHYFIKAYNKIFQYNEIYREINKNGEMVKTEKITANFLQILYNLEDEYIKENDFKVLDLEAIMEKNEKKT